MNSKELYEILENNKNADNMALVSAILEYMTNKRELDFDMMLNDIKELHETIKGKKG